MATEIEKERAEARAEVRNHLREHLNAALKKAHGDLTAVDVEAFSDQAASDAEDSVYRRYMRKLVQMGRQKDKLQGRVNELERPDMRERLAHERMDAAREITQGTIDRLSEDAKLYGPEEIEYPRLSECLDEYRDHRRGDLGEKSKYVDYTVPNAVRAFIDICGDKRLDEFKAYDVELVNQKLSRAPANHSKIKRFSKLPIAEAAKLNEGLKKPHRTLAHSTVLRSYITPAKGAIEWLCGRYDLRRPFDGANVKRPRDARPAARRESLSYEQVADLFEAAYREKRPPRRMDVWLVVLGFFTGARLGELVYLQPKDLRRIDGVWSFDVRKDVIEQRTQRTKVRQVKTDSSRRLIALHKTLEEAGFIELVQSIKGDWIFAELQRKGDPADAASKRMNRLIQDSGVKYSDDSLSYHSLRHTAKDWLRDEEIPEREIDLLTGHAHSSVARMYGRKTLRATFLSRIREASVPSEIASVWPPDSPI